jgi:hypothetical protein
MSESVRNPETASETICEPWVRGLGLGISLAPILGAFLYNQGFKLSDGPCLFQRVFGFPSPACGMTRSLMAIARGDWLDAVMYHLFGPVLFGALVIAAGHLSLELLMGRSLRPFYTRVSARPGVLVITALLFLSYYGFRLYLRYHVTESMMVNWAAQPLWEMIVAGAQAL